MSCFVVDRTSTRVHDLARSLTSPSFANTGAGHSNITITQRYVHPEDEAVDPAFQKLVSRKLVTEGGHPKISLSIAPSRIEAVSIEATKG